MSASAADVAAAKAWFGRVLNHIRDNEFRPGRTERDAAAGSVPPPAAASFDLPPPDCYIGATEQHTEDGPRVMIVGRVRLLTPMQAKRLASELWIAADRLGG
jgi:hypothetical protein